MKIRALAILLAVLSLGLGLVPVLAKSTRPGDIVARVPAANVGGAQTAALRVLSVKKMGDEEFVKTTVVLLGAGGRTVWAPKSPDPRTVYAMGPAGVAQLQVAGDFDGDGKGEVVVEEPQSDVRPQHFSVLRWNGSSLQFVRSACLMETAPNSGQFKWTSNGEPNGRWIGKFKRITSPGVCQVTAWTSEGKMTELTVKATASGFSVAR